MSAKTATHLAILLTAVARVLGSCSTQHSDSLDAAIYRADSLVDAAVGSEGLSGAVLLVGHEGRIRHLKSYGMAQKYEYGGALLDSPTPMTADHLFDLASLTKVFAATFGVMMLVDEGRVGLDEPVRSYLPAFSGPSKDSITVRRLLSHTAGLFPWKPIYYHASDRQESFEYISQLDLAYPVGESRHYSDLGFMLLGYLIEEVSGQTLDVYLRENLYGRLGLHRTGFNPPEIDKSLIAATSHGNPFERRMVADDDFGYLCDEDPEAFTGWRERILIGEVNDGNAFHAHSGVAGHAGLFSTASELHVLIQLLLDHGRFEDEQIISESVLSEFLTAGSTGNGLGWAMSPDVLLVENPLPGTFGHTGFTGTYALGVPAYDLDLVLLTNRQHGGVEEDGRYPSVDALRRSVAQTFLHALASEYAALDSSTSLAAS